jgi:APA family basic amino acid/polyamine antiporter
MISGILVEPVPDPCYRLTPLGLLKFILAQLPLKEAFRMAAETGSPDQVDKLKLNLPRVLGLKDVIGLLIGCVIGSGIFIVPAEVATQVASPILMLGVWLVGGVASFFGALAFSELGAAYPAAGGMYVYLRESFGSLIAFLFGWSLFLVIDSGAIATLAVAFSSNYLTYFVPMSPWTQKMVALAFIVVHVAINYVGVRWGALVQNILMVVKFGAILAVTLLVFIFAKGNTANFVQPEIGTFSPGVLSSFGVALVASLWAYKGWECVTFSCGEIKKPERNLPLGLFTGTLLVLFCYLITNMAYLYVAPTSQIAKSPTIAADAMSKAIGPVGGSVIAFVILFSIFGAAGAIVMTSPRVYFAMARDGLFFQKIAAVHPKYLTPYISILALGVWSAILSLSGTFDQLLTYVIFGQWIFFGLTVASVFILRRKRPDLPRPYKTWGYPITPFLFILCALYISLNSLITQFTSSMAGLLVILIGIPAYLYWRAKLAHAPSAN